MARHVFSALCRKFDQGDPKGFSLIGLVPGFVARPTTESPEVGSIIPCDTILVSEWARTRRERAERGRQRTRILDPKGREIATFEMDINLDHEGSRAHTLVNNQGFPYHGEGTYEFEVSLIGANGRPAVVASVPFELDLAAHPGLQKN